MLLEQVINHVKESEVRSLTDTKKPIKGLESLTGEELIEILEVMALTRAIEEYTACLMSPPNVPGSQYQDDFIRQAKELFNYERSAEGKEMIDFLADNKPHVPFFISSAGTELVATVSTKFSTDYYKKLRRKASQDKDIFYDYYRLDVGIAVGLGHYHAVNEDKSINVVEEIIKNVVGAKDTRAVLMCQHIGLPELGKKTPTSMIGGSVGEALNQAIAQSHLHKQEEGYMENAPDSITKLFIGDAGTSETTVKTVNDNLKLELYKLWRHYFKPGPEEIEAIRGNKKLKKQCYKDILEKFKGAIKLEINVLDNGVGISRTSQATHPFGDPLDSFDELKDLGIARVYDCDGTSLEDVLQTEAKKQKAVRDLGVVITRYHVPRPGGHSASNFTGFGEILEGKKGKALTLNEEEVEYHQNADSLLNTAQSLMKKGVVDKEGVVYHIKDARRKAIRAIYDVLKNYEPKTKTDLKPIMAWTPEQAQENWDALTRPENIENRKKYWVGNHNRKGYSTLIAQTHPIKTDLGEEGIPDGKLVSPVQAMNYSLIDIAMLNAGRFKGIGQDISDIDPARIREVIENLNLGLGGVNRQTAKVQAFLHTINPETGEHQIVDNGIDEPGQYDIAAGFKHAFGKNAFVFLEIQFNSYDFCSMALEQIASLYQRSSGWENIPVFMHQSAGFYRATSPDKMWGKEKGVGVDGAGGVYHTCLNWDVNRFPGVGVASPNTAHEMQQVIRNGLASETPIVMFTHESSMKGFPIKFKRDDKTYFEWDRVYQPLDTPLDPIGTHYQHRIKEGGEPIPLTGHNHVILTHSEYVSLSSLIAQKLCENSEGSIKPVVIDYCWLNPRDAELPHKILEEFLEEGKGLPYLTIVSQQSEYGFGNVIRGDIDNALQELGKVEHGQHTQFFYSSLRLGAYHENHLKNPDLGEIYSTIKQQHQGAPVKPYKAPGEMKGVHKSRVL